MFRTDRILVGVLVTALALTGSSLYAAPARAKSQSIVGTLQKVDDKTLTVETTKGTETVTLAPSARIHHGSKTLAAADLSGQTGARVKVRYTNANGQKEAQSVTVASAKKTAKASRRKRA
jgi:hypothetical protein